MNIKMTFVEIVYTENNKTIRFMASADSARDTETDLRIMVSCNDAIKYANQLDCLLLTPKIVDIIHTKVDIIIEPVININGKIVANCSIEEYSNAVDKRIKQTNKSIDNNTIISGQGKDWVLDTLFRCGKFGYETAINYGWHSPQAPYISSVKPWNYKMWQTVGAAHNTSHCDPSQCLRLVRNQIVYCVDGLWKEGLLENALMNTSSDEYKIRGLICDSKLKFIR